jgi:hypothetical protein
LRREKEPLRKELQADRKLPPKWLLRLLKIIDVFEFKNESKRSKAGHTCKGDVPGHLFQRY